jgi:hypothetical protein
MEQTIQRSQTIDGRQPRRPWPRAKVLRERHVSDSTGRHELSCIASGDPYSYDDDRTLRRFSAADLSLRETAVFPVDPSGPTPWRGRYVFYRSDGVERYVVMPLEPPGRRWAGVRNRNVLSRSGARPRAMTAGAVPVPTPLSACR